MIWAAVPMGSTDVPHCASDGKLPLVAYKTETAQAD